MIVAGLVAETDINEILIAVEEQEKLIRSQTELGSAAAAAEAKISQVAERIAALPSKFDT